MVIVVLVKVVLVIVVVEAENGWILMSSGERNFISISPSIAGLRCLSPE